MSKKLWKRMTKEWYSEVSSLKSLFCLSMACSQLTKFRYLEIGTGCESPRQYEFGLLQSRLEVLAYINAGDPCAKSRHGTRSANCSTKPHLGCSRATYPKSKQ